MIFGEVGEDSWVTYGASLNPSNGVFMWRPTMAMGDTTNLVTVAAFDNGSPSQCVTQFFTVNVQLPSEPRIGPVALTNGALGAWVSGDAGPAYELLGSSNLINWQVLLSSNPVTLPFFMAGPRPAGAAQEFYRIQLGP